MNDLAVLQVCWADLARKVDAISESSVEQLLGGMCSMNYSLSKSICAEDFYSEKCIACNKVHLMRYVNLISF